MRRVSVVAIALVAITAGRAFAQGQAAMPPLAEVARQAEAAKATVKKAKKSYTNSDLGRDPRGEPAPAAAAPATAAVSESPAPSVPEKTAAASEAKVESGAVEQESEESWRNRAASVRNQVDQLRGRLTELTTPNKLTAENPVLQTMVDNDITNTRAALDALRKQWTRIEASAQERKIPLSWIEPQPTFPQ